jgi:hypothetical protein
MWGPQGESQDHVLGSLHKVEAHIVQDGKQRAWA